MVDYLRSGRPTRYRALIAIGTVPQCPEHVRLGNAVTLPAFRHLTKGGQSLDTTAYPRIASTHVGAGCGLRPHGSNGAPED